MQRDHPLFPGVARRAILVAMVLLLPIHSVLGARAGSSYAFIVAGHAYGAHEGGNIGLHPAFLNSLDSGYDPGVAFFVFTGDIVNQSTPESWEQVDNELAEYGLPAYYVMGNHDNNDAGWQVFEDKFGGTYYSFYRQSEMFIVLNSPLQDRSISPAQIGFLNEKLSLAGDSIRNIFIFFHEVLWNSHEKYSGVMANSRSRYDQMVSYSNYWEEVHPLLTGQPEKNFYVIAGDVGGNPDAIAAFYDTWDNVTLLASGMGEVADENYLLVQVHNVDSIDTGLVPLNMDMSLPDITFYSVPPAPEAIEGPTAVPRGSNGIEYSVPEVFNADSYLWELPEGATGTSLSNRIRVDFSSGFNGGNISVKASREGFGSGPSSSLGVETDLTPVEIKWGSEGSPEIRLMETDDCLIIGMNRLCGESCSIHIIDTGGRVIMSKDMKDGAGYSEIQLSKNDFSKGVYLLSVTTKSMHITEKFLIR
jgi:hypothetical protein